jgi:predicted nucleic acid-binding protein
VLDSSVALGWCFEDQHTAAMKLVLQQVVEASALAPQLWPLEVLNGLAMAERRGRLDTPTRERLEGFLRELPVALDDDTGPDAWTRTVPLAHRFQLSVYAAAYLELAQRQQLPLASMDESLRRAGTELGLTVLGL